MHANVKQEVVLGEPFKHGNGVRDAIHIAVIPVVLTFYRVTTYSPGQPVRVTKALSKAGVYFVEPAESIKSEDCVGIIDPFLTRSINVYDDVTDVYLCLKPNTITGMKHEWQHPLFTSQPDNNSNNSSDTDEEYSEAEAWLSDHASVLGMTIEQLLSGIRQYLLYEYPLCTGTFMEDTPYELWLHYETLTGSKVPMSARRDFYMCSC